MCWFISCCTQEMLSTPPATYTSPSPAMTRCAAIAMVCRPEEQKRLTVTPRHGDRQVGHQRDLARDVGAGGAFGVGAAHEHVFDRRRVDAGALHGVLDGMAAQRGAVRHVEGALPALGQGRAGGGDDDGVGHGGVPFGEVRMSGRRRVQVAQQLVVEADQLAEVGDGDAFVGAVEARQVFGLGAHRREAVDVVGDVGRSGANRCRRSSGRARRRCPGTASARVRSISWYDGDCVGRRPATARRCRAAPSARSARRPTLLAARAAITRRARVARQQAEVDRRPRPARASRCPCCRR